MDAQGSGNLRIRHPLRCCEHHACSQDHLLRAAMTPDHLIESLVFQCRQYHPTGAFGHRLFSFTLSSQAGELFALPRALRARIPSL